MASKDELMICIVEIINQQYIYQINQDLHHIFYQDLSSTTVSSMYNYVKFASTGKSLIYKIITQVF